MATKTFMLGTEASQVRQRRAVLPDWALLAIGDASILFVGPSNTTRWPQWIILPIIAAAIWSSVRTEPQRENSRLVVTIRLRRS